jgi:hypothetical protein
MNESLIKFKRGAVANLPALQIGEPAFTTDTFALYVGSSAGAKKIGADADLLQGQDGDYYLDRTNHSGSQASTTISDFAEAAQDAVGAILDNGTDVDDGAIQFTYTDNGDLAGTITGAIKSGAVTYGNLAADALIDDMVNASSTTLAPTSVIKAYVDMVAEGLIIKGTARLATTEALVATYAPLTKTLTGDADGKLTLDTLDAAQNDIVLVKNQAGANATENGLYIVTQTGDNNNPFILTRTENFDGSPQGEVGAGDYVYVDQGPTMGKSGWVLVTNSPIVIDEDPINFSQFSGSGQLVEGDAIDINGNIISVLYDDSTISLDNNGNLIVKNAGIGTDQIATDAITKELIDAGVAGAGLGQNTDGSLEVNIGDGLVITDDIVELVPKDVGSGRETIGVDGSGIFVQNITTSEFNAGVIVTTVANASDTTIATEGAVKAYVDEKVGSSSIQETVEDIIGASLVDTNSIDLTYTDSAEFLTLIVAAGVERTDTNQVTIPGTTLGILNGDKIRLSELGLGTEDRIVSSAVEGGGDTVVTFTTAVTYAFTDASANTVTINEAGKIRADVVIKTLASSRTNLGVDGSGVFVKDITTADFDDGVIVTTVADASDITIPTEGAVKTAISDAISDLNLTETIQDTAGGIATDSDTIDFTYDANAKTLTAVIIAESVTKELINSDVAGAGLGQNNDGSLEVNVGDGLVITDDIVELVPKDVGSGRYTIGVDGSGIFTENITTSEFASGVIVTTVADASDTTIPTEGAVKSAIGDLVDDLASQATGEGGSLIGIYDPSDAILATDVTGALLELAGAIADITGGSDEAIDGHIRPLGTAFANVGTITVDGTVNGTVFTTSASAVGLLVAGDIIKVGAYTYTVDSVDASGVTILDTIAENVAAVQLQKATTETFANATFTDGYFASLSDRLMDIELKLDTLKGRVDVVDGGTF